MLNVGTPLDYRARVRQVRIKLGLTQMRLAERLGVSLVTVNRWENGQSRPSAKIWARIGGPRGPGDLPECSRRNPGN